MKKILFTVFTVFALIMGGLIYSQSTPYEKAEEYIKDTDQISEVLVRDLSVLEDGNYKIVKKFDTPRSVASFKSQWRKLEYSEERSVLKTRYVIDITSDGALEGRWMYNKEQGRIRRLTHERDEPELKSPDVESFNNMIF
jgi:uncharacterized protein YxeA